MGCKLSTGGLPGGQGYNGDTPSPPLKNSKKNKKPLPITSDLCYTYNKVYRLASDCKEMAMITQHMITRIRILRVVFRNIRPNHFP